MMAVDGCAVISARKTGRLLFYSNGEKAWNQQQLVMANGDSLFGNRGITQSALIVPVPNDSLRYYLFTLDYSFPGYQRFNGYYLGKPNKLSYHIVNMVLNNGKGDIEPTHKNIFLTDSLTEKLTAIPHANGKDYWVITHGWHSTFFYVHLVSVQGVNLHKMLSIGTAHPFNNEAESIENRGYLKASPNGKLLACAISSNRYAPATLYDFDAASGENSNCIYLGNFTQAYGLTFSPDNSKLYLENMNRVTEASSINGYNFISQFDLQAGDSLAIRASGMSIAWGNPSFDISKGVTFSDIGLQIGPDGFVYGAGGIETPT